MSIVTLNSGEEVEGYLALIRETWEASKDV
jgi:hypothetical protein